MAQLPAIVLAAFWAFSAGIAVQGGLPAVHAANAIFLILIGLTAGFLGRHYDFLRV